MVRTLILTAALAAQPALAAPFTSDRITVAVQGKGPDVVLVHGSASSARVCRRADVSGSVEPKADA